MIAKFISEKNPRLAEIATQFISEHETEIHQATSIILSYEMITGKKPEVTYKRSCLCSGGYCEKVFLHGLRLDGLSIEDLAMRWKKDFGYKQP